MTGSITRRLLLGSAAALAASRRAYAAERIVVGTWGGDYGDLLAANIDKPLMVPQGIEVVQDVAPQDPRKTKLMAERTSRRGSMDVACLSDVDTYTMSLLGIWEPVTATNTPDLPHVIPALRTPYSIPHIYSAMVVLYNPDRIKEPPTAFKDLWNPAYKGRVGFSDVLYLYNLAISALSHGGSMDDMAAGKAALLELKKLDARVYPSNETLATGFKSEEVWIAPMWLARGVFWQKSGITLAHAVPVEGAIPYISAAAVPRNSLNKTAAFAYLNAMLDPGAQAAFAAKMGYAPTVDNARIDPELMKQIGFTPEQQANFKTPNYDYMAKNTAQILDFWNREFKA